MDLLCLLFLLLCGCSTQLLVDGLQGWPLERLLNRQFQLLTTRHECGKIHAKPLIGQRVVGGSVAYAGEMPWMAILRYRKNIHGAGADIKPDVGRVLVQDDEDTLDSYWHIHCAGSLITDKHVLTAAHCVVSKEIEPPFTPVQVRLGVHHVFDATNLQVYDIKRIWPHKDFDETGARNDIALILLNDSVKFTDYIQPVCLPLGEFERSAFGNEVAQITGWGSVFANATGNSQTLQKLKQRVWSERECVKYDHKITHHICAGGEQGKDSCNGDSGGPLVWQEPLTGRHYLIGLVSYGSAICGIGRPGLYTRITSFLPWLRNRMLVDDSGLIDSIRGI